MYIPPCFLRRSCPCTAAAWAVFLTLLLPSLSHATTLTVPAQYGLIQDAINASQNGDTVLISDGTYTGRGNVDLDFGGRNITVQSVNGPSTTIIDCNGNSSDHRGFYFHGGETSAVMSGLTIKNGISKYSANPDGAGVLATSGSTVTLINCAITGNTAYYGGGGVWGLGLTLTNCTVTGNTAPFGGGILGARMTLTNCMVSGNMANHNGGGVDNEGVSTDTNTLTNCTITGNIANSAGREHLNLSTTATVAF